MTLPLENPSDMLKLGYAVQMGGRGPIYWGHGLMIDCNGPKALAHAKTALAERKAKQ